MKYSYVLYRLNHYSYLPIWGFITYVTKWRRKPTVDFIHCQLFLGGFIDCLEEEVFWSEGASLFFSGRHLHVLSCLWQSETPQQARSLTLHALDFSRLFRIFLDFSRPNVRWLVWWMLKMTGGYLPTCAISAEIAKRRCKPSVDFVKSQLLLGGFSNCLERRQSPVTLSPLLGEFARKWIESYLHFLKVGKTELGSLQGLTLLNISSPFYFFPRWPRAGYLWRCQTGLSFMLAWP